MRPAGLWGGLQCRHGLAERGDARLATGRSEVGAQVVLAQRRRLAQHLPRAGILSQRGQRFAQQLPRVRDQRVEQAGPFQRHAGSVVIATAQRRVAKIDEPLGGVGSGVRL